MLKSLSSFFPSLHGSSNSARVEFYDKFKHEAEDHDKDFIKKYDDDLNITLIFVSAFFSPASVVALIGFLGKRRLCSLRSHPLSLSTSSRTSNQITRR